MMKILRSAIAAVLFIPNLCACRPFEEKEVSFRNGATVLHGSLYIPSGKGPHPAIVFVHGSGPATRGIFRFYAEVMSVEGLAVLIYDKRDVGPIRATELVTTEQLAGDVTAAVQLLKTRKEVDPKRIGVWGGSQGSGIAAKAAAQSSDIAFLISVSGGGISYAELNACQKANRMRAQGFSETEVKNAVRAMETLHAFVRTRKNAAAAQATLDSAWTQHWASIVFASRRLPTEEELATWMQWQDIDGTSIPDWERIRIPVLLFWGERDEVVPWQVSAERIQAALKRAGNGDVTVRIIKGADHGLMRYPNPENLPAKEYLETMSEWIRRHTRPQQ